MAILPLEDMDNLKGVDRISALPEDVLVTIVSQLEMKEAAKTSILSKRWRYIWTNLTALDFDYLIVYPECKYYHYHGLSIEMEGSKYINWVDQVIRQHKGQTINKFRVQYGFYESYERHFDRWVEFALAKKVKKLELEMLEMSSYQYNLKGVDRISALPEDILVTIVSQLEMKEAAKTSILSKRWRYIWTNLTALDFDYLIVYPECKGLSKEMEGSKYINWVYQVIRQHRGQTINKFRVQYGFYESYERHFDRWVEFALAKKVKKLELEILDSSSYQCPGEKYTLKKLPSLFESINFLTCLRLYTVNVSGELLEYLLAECRHLEEIFVEASDTLVSFKVASSKLKKLSIRYCELLKKLEIVDAVNLCYLDYVGEPIIEFKSLPLSLDEVVLSGECCRATVPICRQIACVAMQLSKLSVRFMILVDSVICNIPAKSLPCFSNLKFLELTCWRESLVDLPSIIRLLGACPVLSEFNLQVCWLDLWYMPKEARVLQGLEPPPLSSMTRVGNRPYVYDHSLEEDKIEYKALPCLRVFQLVGFVGDDDDLNLIQIIFNMAVQLHSFICHPLMPLEVGHGGITEYQANESRRRATTLQSLIPPKVNYVITNTYNACDML